MDYEHGEGGWRATEDFESGIERTVDWFLANDWWWRPIRDRWYVTDPANFLLACLGLLLVTAVVVLALASWNLWLLLFALIVFPIWALLRRGF